MDAIFFSKQQGGSSTTSFPGKYTLEQPRFQTNVQSNSLISKKIYRRIGGIYITRILQIWSTPVGYEELAGGFESVRDGVIF